MNATPHKRGHAALVGFGILALAVGAVAVGFHSATAADDHGNTSSTATPVVINVPNLGTLDSFGDVDWFVLQTVPPSAMRVVASGQAFTPRIVVYDKFGRQITSMPGAGTQMTGPFDYTSPIARQTMSPLFLKVEPSGRIGSYSFVLALGDGTGTPSLSDPSTPPPAEPPPPLPPPGDPSQTDDVPAGTEHNFTAAGYFQGRIEVPGDNDTLLYVVPAQGTYEFRLTSEMPDAVGDAMLPHTFKLNSWVVAPYVDSFTQGTEIRIIVHSLSELAGPYRLEVTPPPGMPMGDQPPPPPPGDPLPLPPAPPGPLPPPPPGPDTILVFDPVTGMPPKASKEYQNWINQNYRFTDPTINGEAIDALAIRDRWIQRDNGVVGLKVMSLDPMTAYTSVLAPFGGKTNARTRYPTWVRTQVARMVVGGGTLDQVRLVLGTGIDARRPLVLLGKREGTGLVEAWVAFGIKTIGGVPNIVVLDPSMPGQTLYLPVGPGGILPVHSGGAVLKYFTFLGQGADVIYP